MEILGIRKTVWVLTVSTLAALVLLRLLEGSRLKNTADPLSRNAPSDLHSAAGRSGRKEIFDPRTKALPSWPEDTSGGTEHEFSFLPDSLSDEPVSIPELIARLSVPEPETRAEAATKLGRFSFAAAEAVAVLTQLAKSDSEEEVRSRAKDALINIRGYTSPPKDF